MFRPLKLCVCLLFVSLAAYPQGIRFREVSQAWRIDFRHHHGGSGQRYMVETMVGGVVMFDFDGDGDEDLFFVDGGKLPGYTGEEPRSRLFRNDGGRFTDWTERSGIRVTTYGSGGTAGDVDGDGDLDLYVANYVDVSTTNHKWCGESERNLRGYCHTDVYTGQPHRLYKNRGYGTCEDGTKAAGLADLAVAPGLGVVWGDVDNDGW